MDIKYHLIDEAEKNFIKYNINLPKIKKLRYNIDNISRLEKILLIMTENKKEILHEISKGDKELENMVKKIEKLSEDPKFVSYYDEEVLDKIGRELDIEEAENKGHDSGFIEGQKEGQKEGFTEGKKEQSTQIAKKMLKDKIDIDTIIKYTNLSKNEIKQLKTTEN